MTNSAQLQTDVTTTLKWLAVFLIGFGVGYAGMTAIGEPAAQATDTVSELPEPKVQESAPTELPPLDLVSPEPPVVEEPEVVQGPEVGSGPKVPVVEEPQAPSKPTPSSEEVSAKQPAPSETQQWWDVCRNGRRCRLDFGSIEGNLSIRKATIKHGQVVSWKSDLAGKPREDTIMTDRPLTVQVEAIGFDEGGTPIAAEIVVDKGTRMARGVISLDLGQPGKRIVMKP